MRQIFFRRIDPSRAGGGMPLPEPSQELKDDSTRVTALIKKMFPEVTPAETEATLQAALANMHKREITLGGGQEASKVPSPLDF